MILNFLEFKIEFHLPARNLCPRRISKIVPYPTKKFMLLPLSVTFFFLDFPFPAFSGPFQSIGEWTDGRTDARTHRMRFYILGLKFDSSHVNTVKLIPPPLPPPKKRLRTSNSMISCNLFFLRKGYIIFGLLLANGKHEKKHMIPKILLSCTGRPSKMV